MKNQKITYEMDFTESKFIRDEEKGVFEVHNVSLLGQVSKNGYSYATDAMREAVPLYEGVQAFINHPSKKDIAEGRRDVRDLAGKFEHVRFEEDNKRVKGDFVGLPNENGKLFVDIAENMPKIAGTSQNASGRFAVGQGGNKVVESITKVFSVDLVANPATNNGIFENENFEHKEHDMDDYTKILETELRIRRPELVDTLVKEGFDAGAKSRDDEVKKLTEEKDKAVQEADTLKVEKALAGKSAVIDKMLGESKLPKEAKTKVFKEQLMKVDPDDKGEVKEGVKALIDDRIKAVSGKGGVHSMGGGKDFKEGEGGSLKK